MTAKKDFNKSTAAQRKLGLLLHKQLDFFSGDMNAMQLIQSGADINLRDASGMTPMMRAAATQKRGALRMILERDASSLHATDSQGLNALSHAVIAVDRLAVELLVNKGAVLNLSQATEILARAQSDARLAQRTLALMRVVAQAQDAPAAKAPSAPAQKK